ncbi:hypothetical protein, conserved [Babesia bigemina]|uniref:Ribosome biogenesis protein SLX9 n=1 Tax=Babesia bigemina TaxID=5866 RepID=A0A061DB02_BABBI|nr:hypothetical protein, conserved [Babesia bigemina]CDR94900.1 hypothetical protein, conserved [Babesia bigemina]|eukprot:XP_012767086.1 hypothetical protein, conserved [Babesia bigemina]
MAKLTRIVKKILLKDAPERDTRRPEAAPPPSVESLATRGLAQPTVDFGNLPIIDDNELRLRAKAKAMVKVSRKGSGIAKERNTASKFKAKVVRPKVKNADASSKPVIPAATEDADSDSAPQSPVKKPTGGTKHAAKTKAKPAAPSTKVIKSDVKSDSRGKRKREARKEMWRRKYDFSNEAKRLVAAFHEEDKHGPALGNLAGLKGELSSLEQMMQSAPPAARESAKPSSKRLLRAKIRNKAMLQAAMKNT